MQLSKEYQNNSFLGIGLRIDSSYVPSDQNALGPANLTLIIRSPSKLINCKLLIDICTKV